MKVLLSEAPPDYAAYVFPYVAWGFLEPHETPADALAQGFLPSLPDLSRFYLCRQVRVRLADFKPSSENRRILRKGGSLKLSIVPRGDFDWTEPRREFCEAYAHGRWSTPPAPGRVERIFHSALTTHVALFQDQSGSDVGIVSLLRDGSTWFYSNAFYALDDAAGRGAFLMTSVVDHLASRGEDFLHLGTCYSRSALYKTQFAGTEFFNGYRWSPDLAELKHLVARQESPGGGHLLEDPAYQHGWIPQGLAALGAAEGQVWRSIS